MIDLEALAGERARALAQPKSDWLVPLQMAFFEKACSILSDGQIEMLFDVSENPSMLHALFEGFASACDNGEAMALEKMKDHFEEQGMTFQAGVRLWMNSWQKEKHFKKCLKSIQKIKKTRGKRRR